ncbi:hypothetical protein [Halioxenophilus aromaticivorans]|uniref:Transmembrane protein n=1 Tax=Halioxenophilus aromaticivorans TaxID=1306992 RepID=A0AAV3U2K0_9ALTE
MTASPSFKAIRIVIGLFLIAAISSAIYSLVKIRHDSDCFISDQPYKLSTSTVENTSYSVYAVISGFQEKSVIFHLFKEPISFDQCGKTADKPIHSASTDFEYGEQAITDINVLGTSQIELKTS